MHPYPFTGEFGRHHGRQPPGEVREREGDPEEDFAVVRTQVGKVGLQDEKRCVGKSAKVLYLHNGNLNM